MCAAGATQGEIRRRCSHYSVVAEISSELSDLLRVLRSPKAYCFLLLLLAFLYVLVAAHHRPGNAANQQQDEEDGHKNHHC